MNTLYIILSSIKLIKRFEIESRLNNLYRELMVGGNE